VNLTRLALVPAAALALAACSAPEYRSPQYSTPSYHATCTDSRGYVLADWRCSNNASGARWSYQSYSDYQRNLRTPGYYTVGRRCTCGTTVAPKGANGKPVGIQYADRKDVTVFKDGKQVGKPVKLNQDANRVSQTSKNVGNESKRDGARTPSYGSFQPKKSSSNRSSSSTSRRK
jgi:hypothetical protein